jgi:hypothetical protein
MLIAECALLANKHLLAEAFGGIPKYTAGLPAEVAIRAAGQRPAAIEKDTEIIACVGDDSAL